MWFAAWVAAALAGEVDDAVMKQLALRDGFGGCASLASVGDDAQVRDALIAATQVQRPPWVSMRAATCVVERSATDDTSFEVVKGWMSDPAVPGFALAAVDGLSAMPEDRAVVLAELAVARLGTDAKFARYAQKGLAACTYPKVRALLAANTQP